MEKNNWLAIAGVLIIMLIVILALTNIDLARSNTTFQLPGTAYKTPSGTVVDVVNIPGFGKCLLTPGGPVCK